ncbi:hypothetical protein CBOM_07066 [Ceraceosorus bombacis]|uniref:Uncharacterized protein n=1 Tax=Ceraceosorus bombacis TaxID=401625 RepID=A0A0P1B9K3_9BASI|nr:hypothetical protein CBOM_07066 [Ceraceosorus bombacis]
MSTTTSSVFCVNLSLIRTDCSSVHQHLHSCVRPHTLHKALVCNEPTKCIKNQIRIAHTPSSKCKLTAAHHSYGQQSLVAQGLASGRHMAAAVRM